MTASESSQLDKGWDKCVGLSSSVTRGMRAEMQLRSSEVASPCLVGCWKEARLPSIARQGSLSAEFHCNCSSPLLPLASALRPLSTRLSHLFSCIPLQKHSTEESPTQICLCPLLSHPWKCLVTVPVIESSAPLPSSTL